MEQIHLIISGIVQGVFYRASCQKVAVGLNLKGWVRNLPTGEVELLVQGEKANLQDFIEWCKKGPTYAKVSDVKIEWQNCLEKFETFVIR